MATIATPTQPEKPAFQQAEGQPPVPPPTTIAPQTKKRPGLKIILAVLSLLIVLTAIPAGVYLVRQRQEVRELAAEPTPAPIFTPLPTSTPQTEASRLLAQLPTPTPTLLAQASPTATPTATPTPTASPTATPTATPTSTPTASPSALPEAGFFLPTAVLAAIGLVAIIFAFAL